MRIIGKVDGRIDRFDRAVWLTPIFDLGFAGPTPPPNAYAPEVTWGPWLQGAPWLRYRHPEVQNDKLVVLPPPRLPDATPAPEVHGGPPILGAPWFRIPFQEGLRGSPGAGTILPGQQRPRWQNPRVTRVLGKLAGAPQTPDQKRQRRHSEQVQTILNSLLDQGYIRFVSENPLRFVVMPGCLTGATPPTPDTDKSQGATVGCAYVDTAAKKIYFCVDNTLNNARWNGPY